MIINGMKYESYEDYAEEILAYMSSQDESFKFSKEVLSMSNNSGEYYMYKMEILNYLNEEYDKEFNEWRKSEKEKRHNLKLENEFNKLSYEHIKRKLNNKYDKNRLHKKVTRDDRNKRSY